MKKEAKKYEALLSLLYYRPHNERFLVLELLCAHRDFQDVNSLHEQISAKEIQMDKEKIRMIVKRLNETGILERNRIPGMNKFVFRLKPYEHAEAEVRSRVENKYL